MQKERPKSFELMIDMLELFENFCLSKMMLESIPYMIRQSTDMIVKFFDNCIYKPQLMRTPIIVPWPNDLEEHIFASHTSLISQSILVEELKDFFPPIEEDDSPSGVTKLFSEINEMNELRKRRKELRPQQLNIHDHADSNYKRVNIEAVDFDWIFKGDNARSFIFLLSEQSRSKLFIQKTIRVFIELMWSEY